MFDRFIGVDYSGADAPVQPLDSLAVYCADGYTPPYKALSPRQDEPRWSRQQLAEWLVDQFRDQEVRTVVGIDHGFSFPVEYFDLHQLPKRDWDQFLVDFRNHWPTHREWVRTAGGVGRGRLTNAHVLNHPRHGDHTWKRLTEELTLSASSVFNFNARQRNVAHSTHAGLPWLLHVRQSVRGLRPPVHFWPFDGWRIPECVSVVTEVYPSLWSGRVESRMVGDEHDAYSVAAWLSHADRQGLLRLHFEPELSSAERRRANTEGWILGVLGYIRLGVGQGVAVQFTR